MFKQKGFYILSFGLNSTKMYIKKATEKLWLFDTASNIYLTFFWWHHIGNGALF